MSYTQEEVDKLMDTTISLLIKKLELWSIEQRNILNKKGKLLSYGQHLHLIPKHKFKKLKDQLKREK